MNRSVVRLMGLAGLVMCGLALAPGAWALGPPSPTVTTPNGSDVTIEVSDQPMHFAGSVAGPVLPFDRLLIDQTSMGGDPPQLCNVVLTGNAWECDSTAPDFAVGDHELRVAWLSNDPAFDSTSEPTVITLHVVPDAVPGTEPVPEPGPERDPEPEHVDEPAVVPPVAVSAPPSAPTSPAPTEPSGTLEAEPAPEALPVPSAPETSAPASAMRAWDPTDHPRQVLTIGVAAFALVTLVGPAGLATSSGLGRGVAGVVVGAATAAGTSRGGSVRSAKVKMTKFSGAGGGRGDRSRTWQVPGWRRVDAWSLLVPTWLAPRTPLTARVLADGSYLRAIFSTAWGLLVVAGGALGLVAAHQTDGMPIAPSVALTAVLLVIAILDATAGAAAVLGFLFGMALWPSDQLSGGTTIRSFLGLAALWFAIPLIAAASRPLRRTTASGARYAWDRCADTAIASLVAGWAVQKTIGGMPGLSGLDLPIAHHADRIAVVAMIALVVRVLIEEIAARRYPLRLSAVEARLPYAGTTQRLFATGLRTGLFVFVSVAFIGSCWQLWVGAALFLVPQVLSIHERSFPSSDWLHAMLPRGIVKVLVMLLVGSLFARLVFSILTDPDSMLRNGFVLLTIPGLVLSLLGLFGHDGPDPAWTWPRQAVGAMVLTAAVTLVLTGF